MSMNFERGDLLRFYKAPSDVLHVMIVASREHTKTHKPQDAAYEFKLKGYPWGGIASKEFTLGSLLLMAILQALDKSGFEVYSNIGGSTGVKDHQSRQPDMWICCRPADFDPARSLDVS